MKQTVNDIKDPDEPEGLYAPIAYTLASGGKRLRPMLLLAACEACGASADSAVNQALGIEMYHNFTLLHDDVMDRADVRRGRPTVHVKWDDSTAILSGDAMLTMAGQLVMKVVDDKILRPVMELFNTTAMEVYDGQQYDMDFEKKQKVSVVEYMHMIELKTSALLAGSVLIGALLGGASENDCRKLRRFAIELGLAFQLLDDLLDSYGDERLGKAIGGDILEGKKTYLMVTAMSRADEATRNELRSLLADSKMPAERKIAAVKAIYDRLDVPHLTEQQIELRFERALAQLETLSADPARTAPLREFAAGLMGRNK